MKKNTLQLIIFLTLIAGGVKAQNLIVVQNGGTPVFYNTLDLAIINAINGDTVLLPGGTFTLTLQIDKQLHIIGVGHNLDSTTATGSTRIIGDIFLVNEASNGSIIGIFLNGTIYSGEGITNYLIKRSCFWGISGSSSSVTNWSIIENIIQGALIFYNFEASNFFFSNNIIDSGSSPYYFGFNSSVFKNNIFLYQSHDYGYPIKATYSIFDNNIFITSYHSTYLISNSAFNNNLFVDIGPSVNCYECWGSNNIFNQSQSSIFVNQTGNTFSYDHDYHLQATCPGKNAGKDGTDIGIYGGAFPWKEGSVPPNPHIQFQDVSGGTDQNGNLNVNIKVSAQDH